MPSYIKLLLLVHVSQTMRFLQYLVASRKGGRLFLFILCWVFFIVNCLSFFPPQSFVGEKMWDGNSFPSVPVNVPVNHFPWGSSGCFLILLKQFWVMGLLRTPLKNECSEKLGTCGYNTFRNYFTNYCSHIQEELSIINNQDSLFFNCITSQRSKCEHPTNVRALQRLITVLPGWYWGPFLAEFKI